MSDGSNPEKKSESRRMAEAITRIEKVLRTRSEKSIAATKKDPDNTKKTERSLETTQDFYYFVELVELVLKLNRENETLHKSILSLLPEPKKNSSN